MVNKNILSGGIPNRLAPDVFAVTGTAVVVCLLKRAKKAARGSDSVKDDAAIVERTSDFVVVLTGVITVCVDRFAAVDGAGAPELRENLAIKADLESFNSFKLLISIFLLYFSGYPLEHNTIHILFLVFHLMSCFFKLELQNASIISTKSLSTKGKIV